MQMPIGPDHIYELTTVSHPSLSPDGSRLVFTRSAVDREQMETRSQIMTMSLPDGEPLPFTHGDQDVAPRFAPDGSTIAFIRTEANGNRQLRLIAASGGESRQLTDVSGDVEEFAWSPDSRYLAFTSDVDPDRLPDDHDSRKRPQVKVARRIRYRSDPMGWRGDCFRQLFVVDAQTGEARQITHGEGEVFAPAWSPDGANIAFISDMSEDRDTSWNAEVYVISADGGEPQEWSHGLHCFSQSILYGELTWSPDGDKLAVVGNDDVIGDPRQTCLFVAESGKQPQPVTDGEFTPVLPMSELRWTQDGRILVVADRHGESYLCRTGPDAPSLDIVSGGGVQYTAVSFDSGAENAVVVAVSPRSSGDLYLVDTNSGAETQLTDYNRQYFAEHPPAVMQKSTLERGGTQIQSRVSFPPAFDPSRRYPLIVDIHGGPQGRFSDSFDPRQQVLATAGYIVLAVNPRGSSSYGPDFARAVLRDWGGEDYLDIMAAVDELCDKPYVDSARLGVNGYSYGGFMSSWTVGHTTRFKAAVVGAPCINLLSMYGTSDIGTSFGETQWGGTSVEGVDRLLEHSPLTYAPNVETPVLLMHGEDDYRCPIEQSEQYFVALKRLGKEVEFVRFPGSGHGFLLDGHPNLREEYLSRMLDWFDRHVGRDPSPAQQD